MYQRVIPRDLFNEAKLLKCLGQLALFVHDGVRIGNLRFEADGSEFLIDQRDSDGGLYVYQGIVFYTESAGALILYSRYNSKDFYPLLCEVDNNTTLTVFDGTGNITSEFRAFIGA